MHDTTLMLGDAFCYVTMGNSLAEVTITGMIIDVLA